ncbi:ribosome silencing factor [candidate division KSB1 bacterium]|nr:ribosome silencing factor [candidate division KSB1 bacterium]
MAGGTTHLKSKELADHVAQAVLEKKATDVIIMDISTLTSMADYFVVCTVDSDIQSKAVVEHVLEKLRQYRIKPWHSEGRMSYQWVLVDFVDVVLHVFLPEKRKFYNLERLWGDAVIKEIKDSDGLTEPHQK